MDIFILIVQCSFESFQFINMDNKSSSFKRIYTRLRYKACYKRNRPIIAVLGVLTLLILLHFVLLPSFTGAYHDACYLSEKKLNEIRHLILVSAKLMEKYNMTYWLDYGTLLGAVRFGDVLPWDGDADISSLFNRTFNPKSMNEEFASYGIKRNALVATVNGSHLDYYRWTKSNGVFNGHRETVLQLYYPNWILENENIFVKFEHSRDRLPLSWVVPTRKVNFLGVPVSVPREYEKVLEARYPLTYKYNVFTPYKWKCWLPCWLTRDKNCKKYSRLY